MLRSAMPVLTLFALLAVFTGCAKYPVVVNGSAMAPATATQSPVR